MKFRFKALNKKRQPDQLDSPLLLASPHGWVAVFVVLITAVFAGLWGFLGAIPRTFTVTGVIGYHGDIITVQTPSSGTLVSLPAKLGEGVTKGATLAEVIGPAGSRTRVVAPTTGRVVSVQQSVGAILSTGGAIAQVEQRDAAESTPMMVKLLVDPTQAALIRPGQSVTMAVPGVSPRAFGRLLGTVSEVGAFPLAPAQQAAITGTPADSAAPSSVGPRLVLVRLEPKPATVSGYAWTSLDGPPVQLQSRTPVQAKVELGSVSPFSVLVGR